MTLRSTPFSHSCARGPNGEARHHRRRSASTPTHFTSGSAGHAPHPATESAPSPRFPGGTGWTKAARDPLDDTPLPPTKPLLPSRPGYVTRGSTERPRSDPTMLFYDRKSPLSAGSGGAGCGLYHCRRALSCRRVAGGRSAAGEAAAQIS